MEEDVVEGLENMIVKNRSVMSGESNGDMQSWCRENFDRLGELLRDRGFLHFSGFGIVDPSDFREIATLFCGDLYENNGEHVSVQGVLGVQNPVHYAPDQKLLWHNENSFNPIWPRTICFCCQKKALSGGDTPLVDSRLIYNQVSKDVREAFERKGIVYIRRYRKNLGLSWEDVYRVSSRSELEQRLNEEGSSFEWESNGLLRVRSKRPAVVSHHITGEKSWFNQALHWHPACLDPEARESLEELFGEDGMPRGCEFGDGSAIPDEVIKEIWNLYESNEFVVPWVEGDFVIVDNVLMAHARNAYEGPRSLLVAMGDMGAY